MKRKIGTALDEQLYRRAKDAARRQGRSLNDLIAEALERSLSAAEPGASAVSETKGTYRITLAALRRVLEEDLYDAG